MGVSAYEEPKRKPKSKPSRSLDVRFETPSKQQCISFQQRAKAVQNPITPKDTASPIIQIASSSTVLLGVEETTDSQQTPETKTAYDLSAR